MGNQVAPITDVGKCPSLEGDSNHTGSRDSNYAMLASAVSRICYLKKCHAGLRTPLQFTSREREMPHLCHPQIYS